MKEDSGPFILHFVPAFFFRREKKELPQEGYIPVPAARGLVGGRIIIAVYQKKSKAIQ
jgi:hypothetical protein